MFLIFGTLLSFVWNLVGGIIRRVWNFITCGRCCDAKVVYLKAPLEDVRDNIALWGITSYNIFENPIYQMLFSTDEEYAKTHRHLEELGDIDALAVKEVEMSMKQPKSMSPGSSTKDGATKV